MLSRAALWQAPSVKHKVIALAMAEQARKKEEQLQQERKQKKEQLERQREAARQLAMQGLPKAAATAGDSSAKAMQPAALPASALAPRPMLESVAKASAIPRLKQAMEVRHQPLCSAPSHLTLPCLSGTRCATQQC